ncbi:MAG: structural protein [Bacteroidota bacterium]
MIIAPYPWVGKLPRAQNTDGKFEQFVSLEYGVRATTIDLRNKIQRNGINTISKILDLYAPASDGNDPELYKAMVSRKTGIDRDTPLAADKNTLGLLVKAITQIESGTPISDTVFNKAWSLLNASAVETKIGAAVLTVGLMGIGVWLWKSGRLEKMLPNL